MKFLIKALVFLGFIFASFYKKVTITIENDLFLFSSEYGLFFLILFFYLSFNFLNFIVFLRIKLKRKVRV